MVDDALRCYRFITETYKIDLVGLQKAQLKLALDRGVTDGSLKKVKASYMLAPAARKAATKAASSATKTKASPAKKAAAAAKKTVRVRVCRLLFLFFCGLINFIISNRRAHVRREQRCV